MSWEIVFSCPCLRHDVYTDPDHVTVSLHKRKKRRRKRRRSFCQRTWTSRSMQRGDCGLHFSIDCWRSSCRWIPLNQRSYYKRRKGRHGALERGSYIHRFYIWWRPSQISSVPKMSIWQLVGSQGVTIVDKKGAAGKTAQPNAAVSSPTPTKQAAAAPPPVKTTSKPKGKKGRRWRQWEIKRGVMWQHYKSDLQVVNSTCSL